MKNESGKRSHECGWRSRTIPTASEPCRPLDDEGVPHVQHLVVSHTYGVCDVPPGSDPAEQRKKMDSDPNSSSTMACVWWRNPQPRVPAPNNGNHTKGERREREISRRLCCVEKGSPPPLYIVLGGGAPSLPFPCGTNPTRKRGRGGRPP